MSTRQLTRTARFSVIWSPRMLIVCIALCFVTICAALISLTVGAVTIPIPHVLAALFGADVPDGTVVQQLRLPRVLTAIFAGAALGASGAVFQSVSRNALGSPDVIGFTTGAATGAIVQIIVFQGSALMISLSAVGGGLVTALVVYFLSRTGKATGGYRLILVGIGVGAILSAMNGLLLVTGDLDSAIVANQWLAGSLDARKWSQTIPLIIGTLLLLPLLAVYARRAALLEMGDDLAQQLGIRVERTRMHLMIIGVALAGIATGAAGPIAFVALAAPQLVIRLTRSRSMPVFSAALMGAVLLTLADLIGQTLPITATLPIGRLTGIIGGIYLIWLLTRSKQV